MHTGEIKTSLSFAKANYYLMYTDYTFGCYLCRTSDEKKAYTEVTESRHPCGFWPNTTFRNRYIVCYTSSSWLWISYMAN